MPSDNNIAEAMRQIKAAKILIREIDGLVRSSKEPVAQYRVVRWCDWLKQYTDRATELLQTKPVGSLLDVKG